MKRRHPRHPGRDRAGSRPPSSSAFGGREGRDADPRQGDRRARRRGEAGQGDDGLLERHRHDHVRRQRVAGQDQERSSTASTACGARSSMEFNGMPVKGISGPRTASKGWRKFGDNSQPLDEDMIAASKPDRLPPGRRRLDDPPAQDQGLQGRGRPRREGRRQAGRRGQGHRPRRQDVHWSTSTRRPACPSSSPRPSDGLPGRRRQAGDDVLADYKEFDGIKRATKVDSTRDGNPFIQDGDIPTSSSIEKPEAEHLRRARLRPGRRGGRSVVQPLPPLRQTEEVLEGRPPLGGVRGGEGPTDARRPRSRGRSR